MSNIDIKLLEDLEFFTKIIPKIDSTITVYGKTKLRELFTILHVDQNTLINKKKLLKLIIKNNSHKSWIKHYLNLIKDVQDDITWLFSTDNIIEELSFKNETFNTKELISAKNYMKIFSPCVLIIVYLLIYLIFRYNNTISIKDYFCSIYDGYKYTVSTLLNKLTYNNNLVSFLTNILVTTYIFYLLYTILNTTESTIVHFDKCNKLRNRFNNIKLFINSVKKIYKYDIFLDNEKQLVKYHIDKIDKIFSSNSLGNLILLKKNSYDYESNFNEILQYIGLIDSLLCITDMTYKGFTFPKFDFKSKTPYIQALQLWLPTISSDEQITNDCFLDNYNIILTGPNSSGKTTYIINVMLAVLFAQTIGVTCCEYLHITPFYSLFSYINIPNIVRNRESLFEAELLRCLQFDKIMQVFPKDKFVFSIMDELFTGTTPKESIVTSYSICEHMKTYNNCLSIITTHYIELTNLAKLYPDRFINMKFSVIKNDDNSFTRTYKLEEGISDQNLAIELMHQKGFNNEIINKAIHYLNL